MKGIRIFGQILAKVDWGRFSSIVAKYQGDKAVKSHGCRDIFTLLMFSQISGADSLREISQGLSTQGNSLNHLFMDKVPKPSALSYALSQRPWEVFKEMFDYLAKELQPKLAKRRKVNGLKARLFSVDSTTIDLCLAMYPWAKFHHTKGAVKIHTVLDHDGLIPVFAHVTDGRVHDVKAFKEGVLPALHLPKGSIVAMDRGYVDYGLFNTMTEKSIYFVTRLKENAVFEDLEEKSKSQTTEDGGVRRDVHIRLTSQKGSACPHILRAVTIWVAEKKKEMVVLTNILHLAASTIGAIYKERWQVELFFKQLKQNLCIKSFLGTSENAVKSQIYSALCAILLMQGLKNISDSIRTIVQKATFSFSNMVTMLRINLFHYHSLDEWLANPFIPPRIRVPMGSETLDLFGQHKNGGGGSFG
jgi:hypothetical protein